VTRVQACSRRSAERQSQSAASFIVSSEQTAALGAERGNAIWSVGFSPNGEILAGGRGDNSLPQEKASRTVWLWDASFSLA
jgi:hypothetical protein